MSALSGNKSFLCKQTWGIAHPSHPRQLFCSRLCFPKQCGGSTDVLGDLSGTSRVDSGAPSSSTLWWISMFSIEILWFPFLSKSWLPFRASGNSWKLMEIQEIQEINGITIGRGSADGWDFFKNPPRALGRLEICEIDGKFFKFLRNPPQFWEFSRISEDFGDFQEFLEDFRGFPRIFENFRGISRISENFGDFSTISEDFF